MQLSRFITLLSLWAATAMAITLDTSDEDSICEAVWEVIVGEFNYYLGFKYGGTVGMFTAPYYWWNAGEVFGGWVDYWAFCASDNETFTEVLQDAMYHQAGSDFNYMPTNQSMTEGNDDQGVWAMAIMQAVERNFTNTGEHTWLYMSQAIFNVMKNRWDDTTCGGGLRWQIFTWNSGYNYKNSISNGCLFHLAARLYRFTGEDIYLETAEKVWNWMWDVGYITTNDGFVIYDGADDTENCTDLTMHKWSYTYGVFMSGCAYLYNVSGNETWLDGAQDIISASSYFFNNSIMTETTCAASSSCNNDQRSFRSLFARTLGLTASLMPDFRDQILDDWLLPSAKAAAASCSGGDDHITCGENWSVDGYDGMYGLGEQISAGETIMALITSNHGPLTPATGALSSGSNVDAGNLTATITNANQLDISTKDKAGAAILTAVVLGSLLGGSVWMLF